MNHLQILPLPARPTPFAVLGQPVHHSLSPILQQAAFDELGLEARYYRIEVPEEKLPAAVAHLRAVPFGGWNCTVPLKVAMPAQCDRLAESAEQIGAVNTVVNAEGTLTGHNTDGVGWSRALREAFGCGPGDVRLLVLGAGGAARAVVTQAVLEKCPRVAVANRNAGRARALADDVAARFPQASPVEVVAWNDLASAIETTDLVVNVTSAGLDPSAPPVLSRHQLSSRLLVFDTVYGAGADLLRAEVEAAGARWADGLGMLLHQGAAAFSLWTGRPAPLETMRAALQSAFSASRR